MPGNLGSSDACRTRRWRKAAWSAAGFILLLPLFAMQFTDEVKWTPGDFVFAAVLLFGSLGAYELAIRVTVNTAYRAGAGVAIAAILLLTWSNAAVGITDSEADFYIFFGVPAITVIGGAITRLQPFGMALVMLAEVFALTSIAVVALAAGIIPAFNSSFEILGIAGFFAALFVASACLFWRAARKLGESGGKRAL